MGLVLAIASSSFGAWRWYRRSCRSTDQIHWEEQLLRARMILRAVKCIVPGEVRHNGPRRRSNEKRFVELRDLRPAEIHQLSLECHRQIEVGDGQRAIGVRPGEETGGHPLARRNQRHFAFENG